MNNKFVPAGFDVPSSLIHEDFRLEVLEPSVVKLDYDAVMSSKLNLRRVFAENDNWPADDMTLEENNNDLVTHQEEFNARKAFAYTVLTPDKMKCIGCIYIEPSNKDGVDSEIYFWIRDDSLHLEDSFYQTMKNWIEEVWPFDCVAWPGREVSWNEWGARSHDHI